jgi:hypothetical protein
VAQHKAIELAALRLKNSNSIAFDEFTAELTTLYTNALHECSLAPSQDVLMMQGYCRAYEAILRVFKECALPRHDLKAP